MSMGANVDGQALAQQRIQLMQAHADVFAKIERGVVRAACMETPRLSDRVPSTHVCWSYDIAPRNFDHLMSAMMLWKTLQQLPPELCPEEYRSPRSCKQRFLDDHNAAHPNLPAVSKQTFNDHLRRLDANRGLEAMLPVRVGRPPALPVWHQQMIADTLSYYDYANVGKDASYITRTILMDSFGFPCRKARNFWYDTLRHVRRNGKPMLVSVKADALTKKRTAAVTEVAQRYWHHTVDTAWEYCARESGVDAQGKTWRDLARHFVFNGDEEVAWAAMDASIHVVGAAGKKKHFRNSHSSRSSIGMFRCANANGDKGPTIYLVEGKHRKDGYGDDWLRSVGNPPGSTILPSNKGYMNDGTWLTTVRIVSERIRALPEVAKRPTWWVVLHLDGLVSHHKVLEANKIFEAYRIRVIIENSHSSQINQAFDKDPARASKQALRVWIPTVRDKLGSIQGTSMDQWTLLTVVACTEEHIKPHHWINGFKRVNLHPDFRLKVDPWLSHISSSLLAAQALRDPEGVRNKAELDLAAVRRHVPEWYMTMQPDEQAKLLEVIEDPDFSWEGRDLEELFLRYPTMKKGTTDLGHLAKFAVGMKNARENEFISTTAVMPTVDKTAPVHYACVHRARAC